MGPIAIAGAALSGLQILGGLLTSPKERPKFQIPGAVYENVATARTLANSTVRPGNQVALDAIGKTAAGGRTAVGRTAGSGSQALAAQDKITRSELNAVVGNNALNADFSFNMKRNLQATLDRLAGFQREKFMRDVWEPYQEQRQTSGSLIGAGMQNIFGVLQSEASNKMITDYLAATKGK